MSKEMEKAFDEAYPKGKKEKEPYISHDTLQQTVKDQAEKIHDLQTGFSAERLKTMGAVISNLEHQIKVLSARHNKDV